MYPNVIYANYDHLAGLRRDERTSGLIKGRVASVEQGITRVYYRNEPRSMNSRSSYRIPRLVPISIIYALLAGNLHPSMVERRRRISLPCSQIPRWSDFHPPNFFHECNPSGRTEGETCNEHSLHRDSAGVPCTAWNNL